MVVACPYGKSLMSNEVRFRREVGTVALMFHRPWLDHRFGLVLFGGLAALRSCRSGAIYAWIIGGVHHPVRPPSPIGAGAICPVVRVAGRFGTLFAMLADPGSSPRGPLDCHRSGHPCGADASVHYIVSGPGLAQRNFTCMRQRPSTAWRPVHRAVLVGILSCHFL